jgi:hypothetical protein
MRRQAVHLRPDHPAEATVKEDRGDRALARFGIVIAIIQIIAFAWLLVGLAAIAVTTLLGAPL